MHHCNRLRAGLLLGLALSLATPVSAQSLDDVIAPLPQLISGKPLTRGELVAWLAVQNLSMPTFEHCYPKLSSSQYHLLFSDVNINHPFAPHLCAAMRTGMIDGYGDASFRPDRSVNVAEAAKMLTRALGIGVAPQANGEPWYMPHIRALAMRNVLPLEVTNPAQSVTAELIQRMLDRLAGDTAPYPFRTESEVRAWGRYYR